MQAKELWRVLNVIKDYAGPTEAIISNLFEQAIQHRAEKAAKQEEKEIEEALEVAEAEEEARKKKKGRRSHITRKRSNTFDSKESRDQDHKEKDSSSSDSDSDENMDTVGPEPRASTPPSDSLIGLRKLSMGIGDTRSSFAKRNLGSLLMKRRTTNLGGAGPIENTIQLSFAILPHGYVLLISWLCQCCTRLLTILLLILPILSSSNNMPMSVELLEPFFGENIHMTCQNLEMIMEGDESLEVQGMK